jgi:hypothetical protein
VRLRRRRPVEVTVEPQPDDVPKRGLFTEPVRVTSLRTLDPERVDGGQQRVTFLVEVRDAEGRRCPDLSVQATVSGPERTRTVQGNTDLLGRIRFRTTGPPGRYRIELRDVAAGGLDWDRDGGPAELETAVS